MWLTYKELDLADVNCIIISEHFEIHLLSACTDIDCQTLSLSSTVTWWADRRCNYTRPIIEPKLRRLFSAVVVQSDTGH